MKLKNLEECFMAAIKNGFKYIGVKIQMQGFEECEIIINPIKNAVNKLEYYKKSYNDNLTLKSFDGIKIIGFTHGNTFEEIEEDLI